MDLGHSGVLSAMLGGTVLGGLGLASQKVVSSKTLIGYAYSAQKKKAVEDCLSVSSCRRRKIKVWWSSFDKAALSYAIIENQLSLTGYLLENVANQNTVIS